MSNTITAPNESTNFAATGTALVPVNNAVPTTFPAIVSGTVAFAAPRTIADREKIAAATSKVASVGASAEGILAGLFGLGAATGYQSLHDNYPVIALRSDGTPCGIFLASTFTSARARACKATRDGYSLAIVLSPLSVGYDVSDLRAGNFARYTEYTVAAKVNGKKIAAFNNKKHGK